MHLTLPFLPDRPGHGLLPQLARLHQPGVGKWPFSREPFTVSGKLSDFLPQPQFQEPPGTGQPCCGTLPWQLQRLENRFRKTWSLRLEQSLGFLGPS